MQKRNIGGTLAVTAHTIVNLKWIKDLNVIIYTVKPRRKHRGKDP